MKQKLEEYEITIESANKQLNDIENQHKSDRERWEANEQHFEEAKNNLEEKAEIAEAKLTEYMCANVEESARSKRTAEMAAKLVILNRKNLYLEDRDGKVTEELKTLKQTLENSEANSRARISKLSDENDILNHRINLLRDLQGGLVDRQVLAQVQNNLDSLTTKYRSSIRTYDSIKVDYGNEVSVLKVDNETLRQQNCELHDKLLKGLASDDAQPQSLERRLAECQINELTEKQRANHMTNLYSLVKEQFEKSESRFKELERFNKEILRKNLDFQETIKDLEDRLIHSIDAKLYEDMKTKYAKLDEALQKSVSKKTDLLVRSNDAFVPDSAEVLTLKHQILDLQAESDEKALIARLGTDVVYARIAEHETRKRLESVSEELKEYQDKYESYKTSLEEARTEHQDVMLKYKEKVR